MEEMRRAQKAGSGRAFTSIVVLAILACVGLLIWRAGAGDSPNGPPALAQNR
jgi:hypothetical protein